MNYLIEPQFSTRNRAGEINSRSFFTLFKTFRIARFNLNELVSSTDNRVKKIEKQNTKWTKIFINYEYFKKMSDEENEHANKFMKYQNKRGGTIVLLDIKVRQKFSFVV